MPHCWTEEFLDRSKKALLKIRITLPNHVSRWLNTVEKLMHHAERIQELSLDLPDMHSHKVLSKLSSRAPHLQHLTISFWRYPSEPTLVLFDRDTPSLRTLEFSYCAVPLNSLKLNGLTTLTLHHVPVPFRQNIEELLAMLSCLQDLTQLYLDDALASSAGFLSSAAFTTLQNINLPHLFLILIVAPLSTVIAFLSCVKISSNAEFILECDSEVDSSLDNYSLLSSLLGQKFNVAENQDSSSHPIRSLVIEPFMEKLSLILTFSASERHCCVSSSRMEWGCNIPLQIALNDLTVDRERIISDICCSMPLTHLQSLHVVGLLDAYLWTSSRSTLHQTESR